MERMITAKTLYKELKKTPMSREEMRSRAGSVLHGSVIHELNRLILENKLTFKDGKYSAAPKRSRYGNIKVEYDGFKFDSKAECSRYKDLIVLQNAGEVSNLKVHPKFDLLPSVKWNGKTHRKRTYTADFQYTENGKDVVEDVKSIPTSKKDTYTLKRHMFLTMYKSYEFRERVY